jgi:hypothetical protein
VVVVSFFRTLKFRVNEIIFTTIPKEGNARSWDFSIFAWGPLPGTWFP